MFDIVIHTAKPMTCSSSAPCGLIDLLLAGGAGLGALAAGVLAILAYFVKIAVEAWIERRRRDRRRHEILDALKAEIFDSIKNYRDAYLPEEPPPEDPTSPRAIMKARFSAALLTGEPHIPFVSIVPADFLWEAIRGDLVMLERSILDEVTRYYYTDRLVSQRLMDLRSEAYMALSIPRQEAAMLQVYDRFVPELIESGEKLIAAIKSAEQKRADETSKNLRKAMIIAAMAALALFAVPALLR